MNGGVAMTVCWLTQKLASSWFSLQTAFGVFFLIIFFILEYPQISTVAVTGLLYLHGLMSELIFSYEHHLCDLRSVNSIARRKKLMLGSKTEYSGSQDFVTTKLIT